jgi:hypothetical protein
VIIRDVQPKKEARICETGKDVIGRERDIKVEGGRKL